MIFIAAITTPPSTPSTAQIQTIIPLAQGTITHVDIQFPLGVSALAHLTLNRGLHQLFPTNQSGDFATSNETIGWTEDQDITEAPLQLEAYSWNDDSVNPHTLTVRVVMTPAVPSTDPAAQIALLQSQQPAPPAPPPTLTLSSTPPASPSLLPGLGS